MPNKSRVETPLVLGFLKLAYLNGFKRNFGQYCIQVIASVFQGISVPGSSAMPFSFEDDHQMGVGTESTFLNDSEQKKCKLKINNQIIYATNKTRLRKQTSKQNQVHFSKQGFFSFSLALRNWKQSPNNEVLANTSLQKSNAGHL